jgi:ferric enterobactin receptor
MKMARARDRLRVFASASAAFLTAGGVAYAQQSPPASPPPAAEDDSNEIIVVAQPGDQVRIDRRTYTLRDDPAAQATAALDVLGRLPAVTVAPSGAVTLLGASGVAVQINGQPVPSGNLDQVLSNLTGAEIERIEVITNPSAQFSAQSSGGIINIITRDRFERGFGGTASVGAETTGSYQFNLSPNWAGGPWSLGARLGGNHRIRRNDTEREREDLNSGAITTEDARARFEGDASMGGLQASYSPNRRRRFSVNADSFSVENEGRQTLLRADSAGPVFTQTQDTDNAFSNDRLVFDFRQDGDLPREQTRFNAAIGRNENSSNGLIALDRVSAPDNQFATFSMQETAFADIKLDIERPLQNQHFFTFGAAFEQSDQTIQNGFQTVSGPPDPRDYRATLDGRRETLAAYSTYQFPTGEWIWLPGVRAENYRREIISAGAESDASDFRLFPSIHVRRELSDELDIDFSYSSRIEHPGFQQLDPSLRFVDATRASSGNPNLNPTTTDAYEANITYQSEGKSYSLTFFDRISQDIVSQFTELRPDGVTVSSFVNAGESEQRGLQAILRGPIGEHWRYSVSANLLNRAFDVLRDGVIQRRSEIEYSGEVQLDYREPNQSEIGADHLQLELEFQGPRHSLQGESDEFFEAEFTWRRRLTERVFGIASVEDIFDSSDTASQVLTDDYFERSESRGIGTRLRLTLTYQFGAVRDRRRDQQQPDQQSDQPGADMPGPQME